MPQEWIAAKYPGEGFEYFMFVTIFFRFIINGVSTAGRETVASIATDLEVESWSTGLWLASRTAWTGRCNRIRPNLYHSSFSWLP